MQPSYHTSSNTQPAPATAPAPFDWRAHLPVHPACADFPELSRDELTALGNDIRTNGLRLPIVVHAGGDVSHPEFKLLDGRSRLDAMTAVGITFTIERVHCEQHNRSSVCLNISGIAADAPCGNVQMATGLSETEIRGLVLSLNAIRRHLNAKDRRAAIDALLKFDPGKSDRQIAEQIGSSPTTVGKRRKKAESAGDVSKMDTRTDAKGRRQPAKRKGKVGKKSNSIKPNSSIAPPMPIETAINTVLEATLGSAIERDWREAERALEALTAHTVAQVAPVVPPGKAALVTEIADYFTALAAKLTTRPNGNGEAPATGSDSISDDLSIPKFLNRSAP